MLKCAEERLNESKRSNLIGLNPQLMKNGMKIPKTGLKHQHPKKGRDRRTTVSKQKRRKPLAHIKIISTEEKIGNVLYAAQKITVDIITMPYVKEFTLKIDHIK